MSKPQSPFFQTGASELGSDREAILARRAEFGGKGAGLHALCAAGYRVPPGFTLSTAFCRSYLEGGERLPLDSAKRWLPVSAESKSSAVKNSVVRSPPCGSLFDPVPLSACRG